MVLPIGVVKPESGVTEHGWSMYDGVGGHTATVTLANGFLIYHSSADDFTVGETIELRIYGPTNRKLKTATVRDQAPATREDVLQMLLKNGYDYYPAKAFQKKRFSAKLSTSYSVKGIL